MSLEAVKASIRDRGDKVAHYSHAQLRAQADAMIGPWLVAKAKERIAERNSRYLRISESAANSELPPNETRAQNEPAQ
jgi:hypothetical protein